MCHVPIGLPSCEYQPHRHPQVSQLECLSSPDIWPGKLASSTHPPSVAATWGLGRWHICPLTPNPGGSCSWGVWGINLCKNGCGMYCMKLWNYEIMNKLSNMNELSSFKLLSCRSFRKVTVYYIVLNNCWEFSPFLTIFLYAYLFR